MSSTVPTLLSLLLIPVLAMGQQPVRQYDPPFRLPANVRLTRDLVYLTADTLALRVDLFSPTDHQAVVPAIVFVPGFGAADQRQQFWRQAAYLASRGFAALCIEYRRHEEWAEWPGAIEDVRAALHWLQSNAKQYRIDAQRVVLVGASQGGYLAAMAIVNPHRTRFRDGQATVSAPPPVRALVLINPLLRFTDHLVALAEQFGFRGPGFPLLPRNLWEAAEPRTYVNSAWPPTLILHGTRDYETPYRYSIELVAALLNAGVPAEVFTAGGAGHGFFNGPPWYDRTLSTLEEFIVRMVQSPLANQRPGHFAPPPNVGMHPTANQRGCHP